MPEPDDTEFDVYADADERRIAPAAILLALVVFVVAVVALVNNGSRSGTESTRSSITPVRGRTVGDHRSLAEVYAANRVLRALNAKGVAARGARLDASCAATLTHDRGGAQSWDCDVRADHSETGEGARFVVRLHQDAGGGYAGHVRRVG